MIEFLLENLFSMVADLSIEKIADLRKEWGTSHCEHVSNYNKCEIIYVNK